MGQYRVTLLISLHQAVLDPQGKAIEGALFGLGFAGVRDVRQGKMITLVLDAENQEEAGRRVTEMCDRLLVNGVVETYTINIEQKES